MGDYLGKEFGAQRCIAYSFLYAEHVSTPQLETIRDCSRPPGLFSTCGGPAAVDTYTGQSLRVDGGLATSFLGVQAAAYIETPDNHATRAQTAWFDQWLVRI